MDKIIKVENLSKKYIIGHQSSGKKTFREAINQSIANFGSKFKHSFSKNISSNSPYEEFWALKNINFEVEEGDRIGIIGKNGAGKSTLLKVLSRITEPSTGKITIRGRVASLLEVGTGFNGELTGRENIFLNGAILGMYRAEIKRKFDEIVDFSGVEKFLDTPVKRYSSGMYVRLAFSVAAHLDPEILVVDEVLAVGDADFQKKCLGKMENISKQGRTILFVSHNMASIKALCRKGILLKNGQIEYEGEINDVVKTYMGNNSEQTNFRRLNRSSSGFTLNTCGIRNSSGEFDDHIFRDKQIQLEFEYINNTGSKGLVYFNVKFKDEDGRFLITTTSETDPDFVDNGSGKASMEIPAGFFNEGSFSIDVRVIEKSDKGYTCFIYETDILMFQILPETRPIGSWLGKEDGYIRHSFNWMKE